MLEIAEKDVVKRLYFDNPWWAKSGNTGKNYQVMPKRAYFKSFKQLIDERSINRAVVLMGPRRVGKTVMVFHAIQELLDSGLNGTQILYLSLETPLYTGLPLERLLNIFIDEFKHGREMNLIIFFDEVQYLRDWEVHLKSLVDSYFSYKFVVTGSAAAALRMKSKESGAGRFTDFILPPLTFAEYLGFIGKEEKLIEILPDENNTQIAKYRATNIALLNQEFINYLNYGGYPEAVFSDVIRHNTQQFIKSDIIDKVLLRDLPSLYGINDIQELNRLFTTLAYNSGNEISMDALSKSANVAKNTIGRYLEYLEAAFLIKRVERIDQNAKRFKRAMTFKVYLTNPSMRAALFGQVDAEGEEMGNLTETAIFSQWQHADNVTLCYARWGDREVDMVGLGNKTQKPEWAVEVKWSDRLINHYELLEHCVELITKNPSISEPILVTSKTLSDAILYKNSAFEFMPSSLYCYQLGKTYC